MRLIYFAIGCTQAAYLFIDMPTQYSLSQRLMVITRYFAYDDEHFGKEYVKLRKCLEVRASKGDKASKAWLQVDDHFQRVKQDVRGRKPIENLDSTMRKLRTQCHNLKKEEDGNMLAICNSIAHFTQDFISAHYPSPTTTTTTTTTKGKKEKTNITTTEEMILLNRDNFWVNSINFNLVSLGLQVTMLDCYIQAFEKQGDASMVNTFKVLREEFAVMANKLTLPLMTNKPEIIDHPIDVVNPGNIPVTNPSPTTSTATIHNAEKRETGREKRRDKGTQGRNESVGKSHTGGNPATIERTTSRTQNKASQERPSVKRPNNILKKSSLSSSKDSKVKSAGSALASSKEKVPNLKQQQRSALSSSTDSKAKKPPTSTRSALASSKEVLSDLKLRKTDLSYSTIITGYVFFTLCFLSALLIKYYLLGG